MQKADESGALEQTKYQVNYRNTERLVFDSTELSELVFSRIKPFLVESVTVEKGEEIEKAQAMGTIGTWNLNSLNNCYRLCRYPPGGHFAPHFDGNYVPSNNLRSFYTLNMYLNGHESFQDGRTHFLGDKQMLETNPETGKYQGCKDNILGSVIPESGLALIFLHPIMHEGEPTSGGLKYILRTDVMYKRDVNEENVDPNELEARRLFQEASDIENAEPMRAAMLYRKAFKLSPALAASYNS